MSLIKAVGKVLAMMNRHPLPPFGKKEPKGDSRFDPSLLADNLE